MKLERSIAAVRSWRAERQGTVGLVPTMGALHRGHLSLVGRAAEECDDVAASVFVNPAQFDDADDLERYPRNLVRDGELFAAAGVGLLFAPDRDTLYPPGFETWVEPGAVAEPLEGASRTGHFRGVDTIVLKLFHIVQPDRAYFGQKDAQQLAVIRRMVRDLDVPVEIIACPTVREPDGLALSSRNSRLQPAERAAAPVLYRALVAAREALATGEHDGDALRSLMRRVVDAEPLAQVDYVSVADPETLRELTEVDERALLSLAVSIGSVRLIDNLPVRSGEGPSATGSKQEPPVMRIDRA